MKLSRWNIIMEAFTEKFGWDKGIDIMVTCKNNWLWDSHILGKSVVGLTPEQDAKLEARMRSCYSRALKEQEKNAVQE